MNTTIETPKVERAFSVRALQWLAKERPYLYSAITEAFAEWRNNGPKANYFNSYSAEQLAKAEATGLKNLADVQARLARIAAAKEGK